jgi:multifunctional 2-oxoglutarate metabolism enzyme
MAVEISDLISQFGENTGFIKDLYEQYLLDETLVSEEWVAFFKNNLNGSAASNGTITNNAVANTGHTNFAALSGSLHKNDSRAASVAGSLVQVYRQKGHLAAKINPLSQGVLENPRPPELEISHYGLTAAELSEQVPSFGFTADTLLTLEQLIQKLETCYCSSIGFQYSHLSRAEERLWIEEQIEKRSINYTPERRKEICSALVNAEAFESNLHRKYIGKKWFSLQGAETLIPMVDALVESAAEREVEEIFFGMAHRGRLNILVNTLGKPLSQVFAEFEEESIATAVGAGDVKYHLGRTHFHHAKNGRTVRLELAPNPSHLEFVNPVVEGMVRARQDAHHHENRRSVLPLLLHGDSAFIGQGVVYETLNLANLKGFTTGGTIHIVINNQVGFTTTPDEYRSSTYCTDMALGLDVPVFHVNSEDIEASVWTTELALEYRQKFGRDVIIDLYSYRKFGHNESDDPSFTQPQMYAEIANKKPLSEIYAATLINAGVITAESFKEQHANYRSNFEQADSTRTVSLIGEACSTLGRLRVHSPETGVALDELNAIARALVSFPETFTPHPKLKKLLEKRIETVTGSGHGIEWGVAEALAFGSLLKAGRQVRLTGQDVCRGTFSHRHLVLDDYQNPQVFSPLQVFSDAHGGGRFDIFNSSLSEAGVVGFEFGYAAFSPESLIIWEAQFGDFGNGAQVFLDQFISASEAKWDLLSGVTLFLPHAYEGMGPEHSSARLERYLQLCGEGNMAVCYPSNAAQQFHLIRRQGLMDSKRPLIVMTPKSLLRLPAASCSLTDLTHGSFRTVIEEQLPDCDSSSHVVFLTGKLYYEVLDALKKAQVAGVKVIRIEQLYPFPQFELKKLLKDCNPKSFTWIQEEPQNMGAWSFIEPYLRGKLNAEVTYIGRPASASTAAGSNKRHIKEQQQLLTELLHKVRS